MQQLQVQMCLKQTESKDRHGLGEGADSKGRGV